MNNIFGLGLESSCDETAAAIVLDGRKICSNKINSQINIHMKYQGVVPEIASRSHLEVINSLVDEALREAGIGFKDLSYVAATNRPGLIGSLMIALQSAKSISYACNLPLITINHLEAHLYAPWLEGAEPVFPYLGLLVSGGNTALFIVNSYHDYQLIGKSCDDAVGEAFDKISKYLGLGYPGGPIIEKIAKEATERKSLFPYILGNRNNPDDFRFSYSGIKTAVINFIKENPDYDKREIVYSFQERALDLLVRRVMAASEKFNINDIVIAGGVAANGRLREKMHEKMKKTNRLFAATPLLCTDNGAMVAGLGYQKFISNNFSDLKSDVFAK